MIDNSPSDMYRSLSIDSRTEYYHNYKNIRFGATHNIAIKQALETVFYRFPNGVLPNKVDEDGIIISCKYNWECLK